MRFLAKYIPIALVGQLMACALQRSPVKEEGDPPPPPLSESTVVLERHPRMVMPGEVVKAKPFTLFVGLTDAAPSGNAAAVVISGEDEETQGALKLELPTLKEGIKAWSINVLLSAPDFTIDGDDFRTIQLPQEGPSTLARYELTLDAVPSSGKASVEAYLFHEGSFMGQIGRTVQAVDAPSANPLPVTDVVGDQGAAVRSTVPSHELHLLAIDDTKALVVINEPGKTTAHSVVNFDRTALPAFLTPKLAAIRARGLDRVDRDPVGMGMVKGLGAQLWPLTPAPIREHLLRIYQDPEVNALRIYTNVPGFPWELLRPVTEEATLAPLGTRFQLGRWHLRMGMSGLTVPPTRIDYRELVAMVPTYEGGDALPAVKRELEALNRMEGFRRLPGVAASVAAVVKDPPNGVLHFAGHGDAQTTEGSATRYALRLEDGAFDSTAFVGLDDKRLRERQTLIFFNACELGQADATANIVEGWAPVMLDAGASGYIGALWPVGDEEAAAFAEAFYENVESSIAAYGRAPVTEIMRCLRKRGADRDDPTWQAYVFYGDPSTELYREGVEPTDPEGRYTCE
ncbi:MAG: CHAT domain-containing protein [Myxococcota bacterium]